MAETGELRSKTVLFDLDGTLTDSAPGITAATAYALSHYGIDVPDRRALLRFVGPPLRDSFMEFYGFSAEQAEEAVTRYYRAYYRERGLFECSVYDGVPEMLEALRALGARLLLATSKPEVFARAVLERFGLLPLFSGVTGSNLDGTRESKAEVVACALAGAGVSDPAATVMVGDRRFDVAGARAAGVDTIGVLYGYGSAEELTAAGAVALAGTPAEVVEAVRRLRA